MIVLLLLLPKTILPQNVIAILPELSQRSFHIPVQFSLEHESLKFNQRVTLFHLDHPVPMILLHSYHRGNITLVNEISYLQLNSDNYSVSLGRKYVSSGPTRINATLFSAYAPALDQFAFHYYGFQKLEYEYRLIRLDNRQHDLGSFNRWLYYRRVSLELGKDLVLGFKEAVVATGLHRGIDLKYMNPAALYQLEQLHDNVRDRVTGSNNDNQFLGIDLEYDLKENLKIYLDIIVDDFQVDIADREHVQDVFGSTIGIEKSSSEGILGFEYYFASPWLYTNGGMFANLEIQSKSLGHRSPQSHGVSIVYNKRIQKLIYDLQVSVYQTGSQTVSTTWNSIDNYTHFYDFESQWKPEINLRFYFTENQYFDEIRLTYDFLESNGFYFLIRLKLLDWVK